MNRREMLIIDDEPSIHQVLAQYLRNLGIVSHSAYDGQQGLEILNKNPDIQVVLTDIRIPGMDGLDVLKEIKTRFPHDQVILMTAYSDKNLAIQALRLGADDFLEKPFRLDDLTKILERSYNRYRLHTLSERWQHFLEDVALGFAWCANDGKIETVTDAVCSLLECSAEEVVGKSLWQIKGLKESKALFHASKNGVSTPVELEVAGRYLMLRRIAVDSGDGQSKSLVVIADISQRRILEKELASYTAEFEAKVEERTRSLSAEVSFSERLLDTLSVLVAYIDADGQLVRWNKFAEALTGYPRHEAQQVFASLASSSQSPLSNIFDPNSTDEISDRVGSFPTHDGNIRILSWSTRSMSGRKGKAGRLVVGIDVTEQKQLEATLQNYNLHLKDVVEKRSTQLKQKDAQLMHTARLASLGEMAAGIAHEMKQPLNVISITSDLIKLLHRNGTLTDELLYSNLDKIRFTVERMDKTINHLRGFTRIDSANFKSIRVDEAVEGALAILGEQIRLDDIDIEREIPPDLPAILGELSQIEQVLVNLMQNARDAIEERSRAATANGTPNSWPRLLTIRAFTVAQGKDLVIEVKDTGIGISSDVKSKVFEPFFTTKDAARGTGLGLSICRNIVHSHGGEMDVESEPGKGSVFRVILPANTMDSESNP